MLKVPLKTSSEVKDLQNEMQQKTTRGSTLNTDDEDDSKSLKLCQIINNQGVNEFHKNEKSSSFTLSTSFPLSISCVLLCEVTKGADTLFQVSKSIPKQVFFCFVSFGTGRPSNKAAVFNGAVARFATIIRKVMLVVMSQGADNAPLPTPPLFDPVAPPYLPQQHCFS